MVAITRQPNNRMHLQHVVSRARQLTKSALRRALSPWDRRCRFRDLSKMPQRNRYAASPILQFYSSYGNIGNYTPLLGIHHMLGHTPDTWCVHRTPIDYEFINRTYKYVIIGGAGLLHKCFQPFWDQFGSECKLPAMIWGLGGCYTDDDDTPGVSVKSVAKALSRCMMINVRDDVTAERYNMESAEITSCPTVVHLDRLRRSPVASTSPVLFSAHDGLMDSNEIQSVCAELERLGLDFRVTDNIQTRRKGVDDILQLYARSRLVVTSRLHGAIFAYGLKVPYVAIPRDEKLRAFHRLYGNGMLIERVVELPEAIDSASCLASLDIALEPVEHFGRRAKNLLSAV